MDMQTVKDEVREHKKSKTRSKPYSPEVKAFVVDYALEAMGRGETLNKLARDFEISNNTLQEWLLQYERRNSKPARIAKVDDNIQEKLPLEDEEEEINGNSEKNNVVAIHEPEIVQNQKIIRRMPASAASIPGAYCRMEINSGHVIVSNLTPDDVATILASLL